jgi:hypothetical protein
MSERKCSFWIGHRWEKWEPYTWQGFTYPQGIESTKIEISQLRERRRCILCGKTQDRKVANA